MEKKYKHHKSILGQLPGNYYQNISLITQNTISLFMGAYKNGHQRSVRLTANFENTVFESFK